MRGLITTMILLGAAGSFLLSSGGLSGYGDEPGESRIHMLTLQTQGNASQTKESAQELHRKCVDAGNRLQSDVVAMVPGRTWTWQLNAEKSRSQLVGLRRDLKAFRDADLAFEASLPAEQFHSHFASSQGLFEHLQRDAESLDTELRKGYPTRRHVTNDVLDMQKEINRWRKLHQQIADELHLAS